MYRPKFEWGPSIWSFLHTITIIDYEDKPFGPGNMMYNKNIIEIIKSIGNIIPCKSCLNILNDELKLLDNLDLNESNILFKWSVDLHNKVNKKLGFEYGTTYDEFVNWIKQNGLPDLISFDHDLADEHIQYYFDNGGHHNPPNPQETTFTEKTGYDCAKWLVEYCMKKGVKHPPYQVHSMNPIGKQNIISYVESYNKTL